jgi:Flp pilus assembly protein TadD
MELTIEQALQQGVAAHNAGNLPEAERLYRAILQSQPSHPDANHNLGVLAVSVNKAETALPLFKTALEANPKVEQFLLSYIDALIKEKQFKNAKQVLEHGKKQGVTGDKLNVLEAQLASINETENVSRVSPSQKQLSSLLEHYQNGRFGDAEKLAISITHEFPKHQFAWKVLGATLKQTGRVSESLVASQKSVQLAPQDAAAHNNLGNSLKEEGRLDEAEASYTQAIALKPDYAEAHSNLGVTLQELGRLEEAILHFDLVNSRNATAQSLECLYVNKNYFEFDKRIHSMSALDNLNIRVAAVSAFAAHQMKKKDPYQFCTNPLDFIVIRNLAEYDSHSNNLVDEIIRESDEYQLIWESRTTKYGFQGPRDVFENPSKTISHLESIVQQAVDAYYDRFKSESNIFIKSWPRKHKLMGWYNRLLKNGYHTAHIHPGGWLSGVIYLKTIALSNNDEGAIEFGLHGYDLPITDEDYPRELHRPKRGDIILFPSSLFHRTIPFTTDSERCAIAFDLTPV